MARKRKARAKKPKVSKPKASGSPKRKWFIPKVKAKKMLGKSDERAKQLLIREIENKSVELAQRAQLYAKHAKRKRVKAEDVELAAKRMC